MHECFEAMQALPEVPDEILDEWVTQACRDAAARGVTGVIDVHFSDNLADWSGTGRAWPTRGCRGRRK
ncbi:hypothetical protein ACWCRD_28890 [Streptomyces sp. NPDC002092]